MIRPSRRSPETIFTHVFLAVTFLGIISILKAAHNPPRGAHRFVAERSLVKRDQACHLVYSQPDQCAFVRANCPDEEAGLLSYLQLYFCSLANAKAVAFIIITIWTSILFSTIGIAASDFLCLNLSTIATVMGMSESLTGVTFLAFGNGSPDVFSTFASFSSHSGSLAVGELMGAAGFITAVVAGSMAITKPFRVAKKAFVRDVSLFAIAAAFSLNFLKDGSLRMWECSVMVGFYAAYVVFVVAWHWYFDRRRRLRLAETAARLHQHIPDQQELDVPNYEDDEESRPAAERTPLIRTTSDNSAVSGYSPGTPAWAADNVDEVDDETRDQYLAALSSNMRVSRPTPRVRTTATPIRPSLMGALEFRSVLNALERKSTNSQPIHMRRYSDDVQGALARAAESHASVSHPELLSEHAQSLDPKHSALSVSGRARAVSANDAWSLGIARNLLDDQERSTPETVIYAPNELTRTQSAGSGSSRDRLEQPSTPPQAHQQQSSQFLLSPISMPSMANTPGSTSPSSMTATRNGFLAPPEVGFFRPDYSDEGNRLQTDGRSPGAISPLALAPKLQIPQPGHKTAHELRFTESPSIISSPYYSRPPSIHLPPPSMSPESTHAFSLPEDTVPKRQIKWWPYNYLPAPEVLLSTLFPGLYGWKEKSWLNRILGICTAPSIFLLTITVPVVESRDGEAEVGVVQPLATPTPDTSSRQRSPMTVRLPVGSLEQGRTRSYSFATIPQITTTDAEDEDHDATPKDWNRWLAGVQAFTAPAFVVLIVYANLDNKSTSLLIKLLLGSLIISLVALGFLLALTTPEREPNHKPVLCFMGFFVAIAWISTIASEVVGVLKAFGVILNISDAILGLTVFAVGNSLGDLVADITVARLGYPMMALSACFGGPMLNILLGIGIGGLYQTIMHARHTLEKHPDRPVQYKPYELQINSTLLISGATLLLTLVFLLIVVPLNKWRMDRKIGVGLISIWAASTILNVVLEVAGIGDTEILSVFPLTLSNV